MAYFAAKQVHVTFVALSLLGFCVRGGMMLVSSPALRSKLVRVLPHVIDTVLLLSAVYLAYVVLQTPGDHAWLISKLVGLVLYVVFGTIALRLGKTRAVRGVFWILGLIVFGWVASVAVSKNPLGFLASLA